MKCKFEECQRGRPTAVGTPRRRKGMEGETGESEAMRRRCAVRGVPGRMAHRRALVGSARAAATAADRPAPPATGERAQRASRPI
eukprot:2429718-Pleurochrysis_carterae.AAC.1